MPNAGPARSTSARSSASATASIACTRCHGWYGPRTRWCAKRKPGSVATCGCSRRSNSSSMGGPLLARDVHKGSRGPNAFPGKGSRDHVRLRYRPQGERVYVRIETDVPDEARVWRTLQVLGAPIEVDRDPRALSWGRYVQEGAFAKLQKASQLMRAELLPEPGDGP